MNLLAAVESRLTADSRPTRMTRPCGAQRTSSEGPEQQNRKRFLNNPSRPPLMNDQPHNQNKSRPAINPIPINSDPSIRRQFPPLIGEMKIHTAKAPPRKAFAALRTIHYSYQSDRFCINSITLHKITQT
ncbi:hypothetical protein KDW23_10710 [Burkholderia cenocepacia]|uniref:hypothetical protein n=1 Tax=Burkholderia cenocepacia TaxID=95486 RepID=UPI001B8FEA9A|nr:hypothetical protein [Burkholderia cenocepacia]MBR8068920.1 hypothetical protein [Burkholderia cenocepacia]MBR8445171.1 hypothetical protein [Burkholderia cenocepacia]